MELEILLQASLLIFSILKLLRIQLGLGRAKSRHFPNVPTFLYPSCNRRNNLGYGFIPRLPRLRVRRRCLLMLRGGTPFTWPEVKFADDCPTLDILLVLLQLSKFAFHPAVFRKRPEPRRHIPLPPKVMPPNEFGAVRLKASKHFSQALVPRPHRGIIAFARY